MHVTGCVQPRMGNTDSHDTDIGQILSYYYYYYYYCYYYYYTINLWLR